MTIDLKTIAIYDEKTDEYATLTEEVPQDLVRFDGYLPRSARVLDYGCGPGTSAAYLAKQGHTADAFDASEKMVIFAQKHLGVPETHPYRT
jgi:2-polyprenyl-3-methyl-5-hydroxy-6-metoxy-1,4-benzoquinol methylase